MPDKSAKGRQTPTESPAWHHRLTEWMPKSRKSRLIAVVIAVILALVLVVFLIPAISPLGRQPLALLRHIPGLGWVGGDKEATSLDSSLTPVFGAKSSQELFSPSSLLDQAGKRPGDESRSPSPDSDRESLPPEMKDVAARPPVETQPRVTEAGPREGVPIRTEPSRPDEATSLKHAPQLVETPVAVRKEPGQEELVGEKKEQPPERRRQERVAVRGPGFPGARKPPQAGDVTTEKSGVREAPSRKEEPAATDVASRRPGEVDIGGKPDQYELPGSLTVNIKNYQGAKVKWRLMVVLDDSAAMGLKSKIWEPNKMQAAVNLVGKLAGSLTPGSKMAVRDFYCKGQEQAKKSRASLCMSHMLYDWGELPLKGLKDKLDSVGPAGQTNPCAAVAYSAKTDFSQLGGLTPRILVVTGGATKCIYKEALKQSERDEGTARIKVDVVGLGINRKRESGYSTLAGKTGGIFFKLEKPADVDSALTKYAKALKTPMEKNIEVRGEKLQVKIAEGEEVTLAPGTYTIVLPAVQGLEGSHRTVKDVKIAAGQPKVVNVAVKKGRAVIRTGKK